MLTTLSSDVRQYLIITGNYWAFTLTDGALRMLVVLHFHNLGYGALDIALLFLFYEFFGVVTNLVGGWLGARFGLNRTLHLGMSLQVVALSMLLVAPEWLTVAWVMLAQALSGIAKDLNKMSAKSAIKQLVPAGEPGRLYRWVAVLTGSKNALKGAGFFLGGFLLSGTGFHDAIVVLLVMLAGVWLFGLLGLKGELGRAKVRQPFSAIFSSSAAVNRLAAARLFLFAARDVWFVVALPVYLTVSLNWAHWAVGAFLAMWVIGYGLVQSLAPWLTGDNAGRAHIVAWTIPLALAPMLIALALAGGVDPATALIVGLLVFGALFAINSSLHSFLIVKLARADGASLDVGFYYMANASGRLLGTLLSGGLFQLWGLEACLWTSAGLLLICGLLSMRLPQLLEV